MKIVDWEFLNEPLYRWAIFFVAMSFIAGAWAVIIGHLRAA